MKSFRRESLSKYIKPEEQIEKVGVNITTDGKVELRINNKVVGRLEIQQAPPLILEVLPTANKRQQSVNQITA